MSKYSYEEDVERRIHDEVKLMEARTNVVIGCATCLFVFLLLVVLSAVRKVI